MSSVSSYEGSDKDSFFQRSFVEGSNARHSYLRKTDLLDTLDTSRLRDTDTWSVAATIDDQESVISAHGGGPPSIISSSRMTMDRETDDDRSTLDGEASIRDHLHDIHLSERDLVEKTHLLRGGGMGNDEDDDKRSRSNAAEFGDDGARSATGDFENSVASDDEDRIVDDQIMAPPQPQPSFASVNKSYAELMEENEILQSQLRNSQLAQKHQEEMISNLRNLTGCDDELFGKALNLSQIKEPAAAAAAANEKSKKDSSYFANGGSPSMNPVQPIVNARTLTQKLARLAETLTRFVQSTVDEEYRLQLEQALFLQITQSYLNSLPFGTENQHLLNTAYSDQIRRFHSTLGAYFAKWYRRQTVQSLSLNPATKEYLADMRNVLTEEMMRLLSTMPKTSGRSLDHMHIWDDILEMCAALSLEIHGGDADVTAQSISVGCSYDDQVMALVGPNTTTEGKQVKMVISPLFVDEEQVVLLPARVTLE
ncbi:hypothetical protein INT46_010960 [Mucor plumbeus]|uniref:Uncharacterized protein n=1 Tax=Mucor plumbeus TaxID=97098 RepID=A0A8H7QFN3_9FUNG|nr:hypothetical protein INT46_010960 [Mucor plumbeus]